MIVVAACSLAGVGEAASQTKHLAGVVRDEAGNPVPGVSVKILDSWQYVITDSEGRFYINTDKADGKLSFSCIGYKNEILPITENSDMEVKMLPDASCSDEMLDIALDRTEPRFSYTGSMSTVKSREIELWQSKGLNPSRKARGIS